MSNLLCLSESFIFLLITFALGLQNHYVMVVNQTKLKSPKLHMNGKGPYSAKMKVIVKPKLIS